MPTLHGAPARCTAPALVAVGVIAASMLSPAATATPALSPCDWVTASEAAQLLGMPSVQSRDSGDQPGSVDQRCDYDSRSGQAIRQVTSQLKLPGSSSADAQTAFDGIVARSHDDVVPGTDVTGLPGPAYCTYSWGTGGGGDELDVVLDGGRLYSVLLWRNDLQRDSCDTAKRFAETAIQRIGE